MKNHIENTRYLAELEVCTRIWREQVLQYVVDDEALEAFCASLSASLGLSD